jgi:ATP-dependent DNA helicase RecG
MAMNRYKNHPWKDMGDAELLQSAGLASEDMATGAKGYNLAAVMLLGRDEVIRSVSPVYRTDALLRKVNLDRYDDRLIVETNLIDSYGLLMGFAQKHLWDKFYLEGDARISLRDAIAREMLVNTLIHREFTSSYFAKFVIEKDRMLVENANRAVNGGALTLEDFEPNPKNPIIAAFFRNIGLADELGSGVRNLYKYGRRYSGKDPELIDGDVFRIIVPLDDGYSFDADGGKAQPKAQVKRNDCALDCALDDNEKTVLAYFGEHPDATQVEAATAVGKSRRAVQDAVAALQNKRLLNREGGRKAGRWVVVPQDESKSFDVDGGKAQPKAQVKRNDCALDCALNCALDDNEKTVLAYLGEHPDATQVEAATAVGKSRRAVQGAVAALQGKGLLNREGGRKTGRWIVKR